MNRKIDELAYKIEETVDSDAPVWKAWRVMKSSGQNSLPVVKGAQVIGLITGKDILKVAGQNGGQNMPVKDAMTLDPLCVDATENVREVLEKMLSSDRQIAVVFGSEGEPFGLFSWDDAIRYILGKF